MLLEAVIGFVLIGKRLGLLRFLPVSPSTGVHGKAAEKLRFSFRDIEFGVRIAADQCVLPKISMSLTVRGAAENFVEGQWRCQSAYSKKHIDERKTERKRLGVIKEKQRIFWPWRAQGWP